MKELQNNEGECMNKPNPKNEIDVSEAVLGKWSNRVRNACGVVAVLTTCAVSGGGMIAIYDSVKAGQPWPSDITIFLLVAGPVVISWSYMNVNRLLSLLFDNKDGTIDIKERVAAFIDPKNAKKETPKSE